MFLSTKLSKNWGFSAKKSLKTGGFGAEGAEKNFKFQKVEEGIGGQRYRVGILPPQGSENQPPPQAISKAAKIFLKG